MIEEILKNQAAVWGFVGVVVGSILATAKDLLLDWVKHKRNRNHAAVRIVTLLDVFIDQCRDVAFDKGEPDFSQHDEGELGPSINDPESPPFPDDIDWQALDPQLAYRILSLPALYSAAKSAIRQVDHGPPDHVEFFEERRYQFAKLGRIAMCIVKDLRVASGLSERASDNEEWSAKNTLPGIVREEEAKRAAAKAASERRMAEFEGESAAP
jgi:hypothetical protein